MPTPCIPPLYRDRQTGDLIPAWQQPDLSVCDEILMEDPIDVPPGHRAVLAEVPDEQNILRYSLEAIDQEAELVARREQMVCSKLQAKLAIAHLGLISDFMSWKAELDPVADFVAVAFLEDAQTWRRLDPTFLAAMSALGKTDAEADAFFELAMTL